MAWINTISEHEATGVLKDLYADTKKKRGKLSNIMIVHSLNPDSMKKHIDLYLSLMFKKGPLSREDRELIGVVVSKVNKCEYCIYHHAEALNHYWKDEKKLKDFINNFNSITIPKTTKEMIYYVEKLTKTPHLISKKDILKLKNVGFTDEHILNINLITSYFNFVNRIALGLGVDFSNDEIEGYKY